MAAVQPDAIALLKADHRKVEDLFAKFKTAKDADKKRRLAKQICAELTVHTSARAADGPGNSGLMADCARKRPLGDSRCAVVALV